MSQTSDGLNWFERMIGYISPGWAMKRMVMRQAYDAASHWRSNSDWYPVDGRAELINGPNRALMIRRARSLELNSDVTEAMINAFERNVVGAGFMVQADTGNEDLNNKIESLFREWCRPENCDVTGTQSFLELCTMAVRRMRVDGGMLFLKSYEGNKRFPFMLQAREVTDLDSGIIGPAFSTGQTAVIDGVEVNANGKPLAYYLQQYTPDGYNKIQPLKVPASDMIALWIKKRPGQVREVTPLSVTMNRVKDMDDYMHTVSLKEKILACMAIFIKRQTPNTGRGITPGRAGNMQRPDGAYSSMYLTPGMIEELEPGDEVQTVIPAGQASNARDMLSTYTRLSSASQGLSYEVVSRDMSQTNYSSARQALIEDRRTYQRMQQYLIDHLLRIVYTEFIKSAVVAGTLKIPGFWENQEKYLNHTWTTPGWTWIDPLKEVTANTAAINSGQETLSSVCARTGNDWRAMMEQRAAELVHQKELEERYGIKFKGGDNTNEPIPDPNIGRQQQTE